MYEHNGLYFPHFMQLSEKFSRLYRFYMGKPRNHIHGPSQLQHIPGDSASAVTVAVRDQGIPAQIFVFELIPASQDCVGSNHSIIGGISGIHILSLAGRIHKIGEDLTSVDAPPPEQVVRDAVKLIPADFRRHKGIDFTLL